MASVLPSRLRRSSADDPAEEAEHVQTDDRPATPAGPKPSFSDGTGLSAAGERFTGGGRIDPPVAGKTTFGFNVDATDRCSSEGPIKGELQTVNHPTKTLIHSLTIDDFFEFFEDPKLRPCRSSWRCGC